MITKRDNTKHFALLRASAPHRAPHRIGRKTPGNQAHINNTLVMGSLVHTGLGSSSLVAHVLHYSPPPTRTPLQ